MVLVVLLGLETACNFEIPGYPPSALLLPVFWISGVRSTSLREVLYPYGILTAISRSVAGRRRDWSCLLRRKIRALEIVFDKSDEMLEIKARCPNEEGKGCVTEFYIDVPQDISLEEIIGRDGDVLIRDLYGSVVVKMRKGFIEVENFSGSLIATVNEGSIRARILDLREKDEVKLLTENGDIILYLEPDLKG